jgi:3-hydroxyacyl-[acyl-carrier-protein] dehydratase
MIQDIAVTDLIPHRPPFLWVDTLLEYDSSLVTEKYIPETLDVFQGHYPDHPILPGVLLCEALFQTGAILIALLLKENKDTHSGVPVLTRIEGARFKRPVGPGDTIRMHVRIKEHLGGAWFLKGTLRVRGKVAVSVDFSCTLAEL